MYVNVEQVDKRFLRSRLGEDDGWLYKKSGSDGDGHRTREGEANPYEAYFCFWQFPSCAVPPVGKLAETLPAKLDIDQMLRVGAVNAISANTDTILPKDDNYLFYDRAVGGRLYLPWDLDTSLARGLRRVHRPRSGWHDALYRRAVLELVRRLLQIVESLLAGPFAVAGVHGEIDNAEAIAGAAIDADPHVAESAGDAADGLRSFWTARHAEVTAQAAAQ